MYRIELCNEFYDFSLWYDFSFQSSEINKVYVFCDFLLQTNKIYKFYVLAIFRAVLRFVAVVCLANCLMTTEASRLADFTKFAKFRSLNDFRVVL